MVQGYLASRSLTATIVVLAACSLGMAAMAGDEPPSANDAQAEAQYLTSTRAVTSQGRNGESYYSPDGKHLLFQSIRGDNPHYQIYSVPADGSAPAQLISTGKGKTTCSFWRPDAQRIIYASSHLSPPAPEEKEPEESQGEGGKKRSKGYRWDFDPGMDIFESAPDGSDLKRLTSAPGYDAEGSYSPDGSEICFTSQASGDLEVWVMKADGSDARQLTQAKGYDGGPFFSPDGQRIVFRGFRTDDHRDAQIYTIGRDGSDEVKLTDEPGTLNWGPFYHPSGRWIVYSSNRDDPARRNFELYLIRHDGSGRVRLTWNDGFDALPTFSPDGKKLTWTSSRGGGAPQVWVADFVEPQDQEGG